MTIEINNKRKWLHHILKCDSSVCFVINFNNNTWTAECLTYSILQYYYRCSFYNDAIVDRLGLKVHMCRTVQYVQTVGDSGAFITIIKTPNKGISFGKMVFIPPVDPRGLRSVCQGALKHLRKTLYVGFSSISFLCYGGWGLWKFYLSLFYMYQKSAWGLLCTLKRQCINSKHIQILLLGKHFTTNCLWWRTGPTL